MTSNNDELDAKALQLFEDALERPADTRLTWIEEQTRNDAPLKARTLELMSYDERGSSLKTGNAAIDGGADLDVPERIGVYRIDGLIGQGGMGAVFHGHRDSGDFEHHVAIKLIRPNVLSDALIGRFERERQTLANLSHPNIARLYDGGTTEDGAPYIIMEYVDGAPITDWADTAGLSLDQRLALFSHVCRAVAYAHQNLVIHRDITPSNVLVTPDGDVKLIDFGIAKPFADDNQPPDPMSTLPSLSFTPGFAAPERKSGSSANTLTDIYSLGKLFEAMVPKSQETPEIRHIIEHAAAFRPGDRYASAGALLEDIDNLRGGYPVNAMPQSAGYRLGKYVTRHRTGVTLGFMAVTALAVAFALTLVSYLRAETALESANARFAQSRELSKQMVFDVYDDIDQIAGTLDVREKLVTILRDYANELAADPLAPDDILMDVAIQYNRLSDLYGGIGVSNLGDTETSHQMLLKAEDVLDRLLVRDPDNVEAIDEMIWTQRLMINQLLIYKLDVKAARAHVTKAKALAEHGLTLPGAGDTPLINRFWNLRTDHLKVLSYENRLETALEEVRKYRIEIADPALDETLNGRDRKAAYFASQEVDILIDLDRGAEAVEPAQAAVEIYEGHVSDNPESYYHKMQAMRTGGLLAFAARKAGRGEQSIAAARRSVELARQLKAGDPNDANGDQFLATQLDQLAQSLAEFGDLNEALDVADDALVARRSLVERYPENLGHERDLAMTLRLAATVYGHAGRTEEQCDMLGTAHSMMTSLRDTESLTDFDAETRMTEITQLQAQFCQ